MKHHPRRWYLKLLKLKLSNVISLWLTFAMVWQSGSSSGTIMGWDTNTKVDFKLAISFIAKCIEVKCGKIRLEKWGKHRKIYLK